MSRITNDFAYAKSCVQHCTLPSHLISLAASLHSFDRSSIPLTEVPLQTNAMAESYERERRIAELAVQKAVIVTKKVLSSVEIGEFRKGDRTSVSLADFAAQALLVAAIHHNFPGDTIVGEEETAILRSDPKIADRVWELVSTT
jgi:hypothetical protein